jgi:type I restriction enzyme, S subunit
MSKMSDWKTYQFEEFVEHVRKSVEPTPDDSARFIGLKHLDSGSLHIHRWGTEIILKGKKLRMRKGDILFAKRNAYLRRVAIAPFDGIFSAHGMVLRPKTAVVLPEFLPHFLQSEIFFERALAISVGSLSPTINWKSLAKQEFFLPPKDEQRRIAKILWSVDDTEEQYANLLNIQTAFFDVYISNFISGRITQSKETKSTKFGSVPSHWEVLPVAEIAQVDYGISESVKDNKDPSIGWPIITGGNITLEGKFDLDDLSYIKPPTKENFLLKKGDLLFNWRSGSQEHVGKTARFGMDGNYTYASFILRIRVKEKINNIYLHHLLNHMRRTGLLARTTSQQVNFKMNATIFKKLPIIVPPYGEQQIFVEKLESFEKHTQEIINHLHYLKLLKTNLIASHLGSNHVQ